MKVLIASDSFKGCMTSMQANAMMEKGLQKAGITQTERFVISDGGEGMCEAFARSCHGSMQTIKARDLYGKPISAKIAMDPSGKTICIEAASVLSVTFYDKSQRHPMDASSYGLGILMKKALELNPNHLIVGLGGTGTNDGGMGLLAAFGAVFYDENRKKLPCCAASLNKIAFIDKRNFRFPFQGELTAACDVMNPLLGRTGATYVFGKQKGLKPGQIHEVENGMNILAAKIQQTFHVDMASAPGSGAAGGLGGMLQSVFHADFTSGIDVLDHYGHLAEKIAKADYVFTGEGQSDEQSAQGKAVAKIANLAQKSGTPVICVSGALGIGYEKLYEQGVGALFSTADRAMSFASALKQGAIKLEQSAYNIGKLLLLTQKQKGEPSNGRKENQSQYGRRSHSSNKARKPGKQRS